MLWRSRRRRAEIVWHVRVVVREQLLAWRRRAWMLRQRLARLPRRIVFPLVGLVLAQVAPLGLLLTRAYEDDQFPSVCQASQEAHLAKKVWLKEELNADSNAYVYLTVSAAALFVGAGVIMGRQEDRLRQMRTTDRLTGLINRATLWPKLNHEVERARRYNRPLSLMIVGLDWLNVINDDAGRPAGDKALAAVGRVLQSGLRGADIAARYSGGEFVVVLPETSGAMAMGLARRLGAEVGSQDLGPTGAALSVSIGLADLVETRSQSGAELFSAADDALFRAKAAGRSSVVVANQVPMALFDEPTLAG